MLYPLKFKPVYKDYVWGGRNFSKLGKQLPEGIVAESWEVSCHKNGPSVVLNGEYEGILLCDLVKELGRSLSGSFLKQKDVDTFPLMVKLIDADKNLSVQVHPDDNFARINENGECGKNEVWYILSAEPGAKLVYGLTPGISKEAFTEALNKSNVMDCLRTVEVFPGDTLYIPAGIVHSIGKGIMLAEIQQNSDITYRVYDYGRTDRQLHIEKALQVIDFNLNTKYKYSGLKVEISDASFKTYIVANENFAVEIYDINDSVKENADGSKFCVYTFFEGSGKLECSSGSTEVQSGESVLIPADMGEYRISGSFRCLKCYVPDIKLDIIGPLVNKGFLVSDIVNNIPGLNQN